MSQCIEHCGHGGYGGGNGLWTNTGTILVLFILLAIIIGCGLF